MTMTGLLIAGYFLTLIPLCIRARKSMARADAEEHYLADRSLGFLVLFLTLYATSFSGNSLLGYAGQAYKMGFYWVIGIALWVAVAFSFHMLAPKLRPLALKHRFITPGDWLRYRFKNQLSAVFLRKIVAICLCIAMGNFLFAQLKAAGEILEVLSKGNIPYHWGIVVFALVILIYDSMGGLRAVAWTDVFQGLVMCIGSLFMVVWLLDNTGGFTAIGEGVAKLKPESLPIPNTAIQLKWLGVMLLGGLSVVVYPQTLQRIFASASMKELNQSFGCLALLGLVTNLIVLFVGWSSIVLLAESPIANIDQVIPTLLELWAESSTWNSIAAAMILLAILAAIMSTADSVLLSLVSMLRHDLPEQSARNSLGKDHFIAIGVMILVVLAAMNRDVTLWRLIELKLELLVQCFPSFVIALHWRRVNAVSVLSGLITGLLILVAGLIQGVPQLSGINIGLIALTANIAIMIFVQFCFPYNLESRSASDD